MVINMNEKIKEDFDVINNNWKKKVLEDNRNWSKNVSDDEIYIKIFSTQEDVLSDFIDLWGKVYCYTLITFLLFYFMKTIYLTEAEQQPLGITLHM